MTDRLLPIEWKHYMQKQYDDCFAFVCYFYHREFNVDVEKNMNCLRKMFDKTSIPKQGDVVFFMNKGVPHVGIVGDFLGVVVDVLHVIDDKFLILEKKKSDEVSFHRLKS